MDAHATPTRHVADDGIARHRLTTLRVPHHQSVDALNAHALRRARHGVDEALEHTRLWRLARFYLWEQVLDRERDIDVSLADRRKKLRRIGEAQLSRRFVELIVVRFRETTPLELPVEHFLTELFGRRLRFTFENLANLVARTARADVCEPVARRLRRRRRDDLDRLRVAQRTREGRDAA